MAYLIISNISFNEQFALILFRGLPIVECSSIAHFVRGNFTPSLKGTNFVDFVGHRFVDLKSENLLLDGGRIMG